MVEKIEQYKAVDGKLFDTREEAEKHEATVQFKALVGLSDEDVQNIINGKFSVGREAAMALFRAITKYREENGEVQRRKPKVAAADPIKAAA